ncbi:spindle pole body component 110-like isoform X2 [Homalodisca vitripennis]|nr:spindle pole body component 110-like isoform X2 [Homalodisca vitripennis]XP_046661098.1 spindle pole body component 110-like isoform X2 [Homalodisca vitripennis]
MTCHRQQQSPTNKSDKNILFHHSEMVDNLQQQLALAMEEKRTVEAMWKASLREVDTLQEQLQQYQSGHQLTVAHNRLNDVQKDYTEAIKLLESKLVSLKAENNQLTVKTQLLEDQLMQVTSQMALMTEKNLSLSNALKESRNHEQELKSGYLTLEAKYIELDKSYEIDKRKFARAYEHDKVEAQLHDKVEAAVRQRDELQAALERCHERMAELLRNAASDRNRVEEAVALAESVIVLRDDTIAQQNALAEEIKRLKAELERVNGEADKRAGQETSTMRRQYDLELITLRDQLRVSQQERDRKYAEVSQLQRECERLQALVDQGRLPAGTDNYRRDQRFEQAYQELQRMDTDCQQLQKENHSLRDSLIRLEER